MCYRRAQISIEFLIIAFFVLAIILSLFTIYVNMRNAWASGHDERQAQIIADRLADAINAVEQGIEGSEAFVHLEDADWLELGVRGRSVRAAWPYAEGKREVSAPLLTDQVDFAGGKFLHVQKQDGKVIVRPV